MSVYATIFGYEDHPTGMPRAYRGSHILPADDDPRIDPRDGEVMLAQIPGHITRDGRDDAPEDGRPWPWARLSVIGEDVVLDPAQARALADALTAWADRTNPTDADSESTGMQINIYPSNDDGYARGFAAGRNAR